ncbi:MAG: putative membrane protein [Bacteroidales bacterium]
MEYVFQILLLFILVSCLLKLSFWKLWQTVVFALLCAGFIIGTCRFAILQSKTQLADLLGNAEVMQNAAVLVTVESAVCFAFCFATLCDIFGRQQRKRWLQTLHWYPGLLLFPVLFYMQTQLIFALPGTGFTIISYTFAAAVLAGLPLAVFLVRRLYPEKELRLEVHFLAGLFVCLTGLITTVNGNVTYAAVKEPLNVKALLLSLALFAVAFYSGFIGNKVKWMLRRKKNQYKYQAIN